MFISNPKYFECLLHLLLVLDLVFLVLLRLLFEPARGRETSICAARGHVSSFEPVGGCEIFSSPLDSRRASVILPHFWAFSV